MGAPADAAGGTGPGKGDGPVGGPGGGGAAGAAGAPAGFSLNRPMRCWPHDWQLSGGVGRLTSAPQLTQT